MKNITDNIKSMVVFCILIGIMYITGIGCPIRFVFGICCPGCGLTRAYISLLHGNFNMAFIYHPLFILPPIVYVIHISNINYKIKNSIFFIIAFLFLFLYLLRVFDSLYIINNKFNAISNHIYIDIKKGFIYEFINSFLKR